MLDNMKGLTMIREPIVMLALLLTCGAAQASEWVYVTHTTIGKFDVFADVSSIRIEGAIRRAWLKDVFDPHAIKGTGSHAGKWMSHTMMLRAYKCSESTHKIEALTDYYEDGSSFSISAKGIDTLRWEPVVPDTIDDEVEKFVCSWKPK